VFYLLPQGYIKKQNAVGFISGALMLYALYS